MLADHANCAPETRRNRMSRHARTRFIVIALSAIGTTVGRAQLPGWQADSAVDKLTDRPIIWEQIQAISPVNALHGEWRPSLAVICFTSSDTTGTLTFRLERTGSVRIVDTSPTTMASVALRFDSLEAAVYYL